MRNLALKKILAGIDNTNTVRINAQVIGKYSTLEDYGCVFDSGFNGDIAMGIEQVATIGLDPGGAVTMELADGTLVDAQIFLCKVKIGDIIQNASAVVMGSDVLLGMGLMAPFDVCLRSATSEALVEPQPAYKDFAGLLNKITTG